MTVLDHKTFNTLKESMGEDIFPTLMATFFRDGTLQIAQMRESLAVNDYEVFRRAAHSLKSSALIFGASDLAALARELEKMGQEKNSEVGNRLDALKEAFELVQKTLSEMS